MPQNDGSIVFNTKIDDKGFKDGAKRIKDETNDLSKNIFNKFSESSKKVSSILGSSLKTSAKIASSALGGIGAVAVGISGSITALAHKTSSASKEILINSQKAGLSAESYQKWDYVLKKSGTSIDIMPMAIKKLSTSMQDAIDGGENATNTFEKMGISIEDLKNMSPEQIFEKSVAGLQKMQNGAEKTTLATQLFGRSSIEMGALLNKSQVEVDAMQAKLEKYGLVVTDEMLKQSAAMKTAMADTMLLAQSFQKSVGIRMSASIGFLKKGINDLIVGNDTVIENIGKGLDSFSKNLVDILGDTTKMITDISKNINKNLPQIMKMISKTITDYMPDVVDNVIVLLNTITDALIDNIDIIIDVLFQIIDGILDTLDKSLPKIIDASIKIIMKIIDNILKNVDKLLDMVVKIIESLAKALIDNIDKIIEAVINITLKIIEFVLDNIDIFVDLAFKIIEAVAFGLIKAIPILIAKTPEIIGKLIIAFIKLLPKLFDIGYRMISEIVNGFISNFSNIFNMVSELSTKIHKWIMEKIINPAYDWGKNIIKGLADGFMDSIGWLGDKMKQGLDKATHSVMNFLGMHSPSKLFAGIGENMALGLGKGFDSVDLSKSVNLKMKGVVNSIPQQSVSNNTYNNSTYSDTYNFSTRSASPEEIARSIRMQKLYGLAGAR